MTSSAPLAGLVTYVFPIGPKSHDTDDLVRSRSIASCISGRIRVWCNRQTSCPSGDSGRDPSKVSALGARQLCGARMRCIDTPCTDLATHLFWSVRRRHVLAGVTSCWWQPASFRSKPLRASWWTPRARSLSPFSDAIQISRFHQICRLYRRDGQCLPVLINRHTTGQNN